MTDRVLVPELAREHPAGEFTVRGDEGHHLARVSRVRPGDRVVLFDGTGTECDGRVLDAHGDAVRLAVGPLRAGVGADHAGVILLQGVPKGDKLETIVRQATELGVRAVWPVYTARSIPQPRGAREDTRTERLQRIAREASRQCNRADVPAVPEARSLAAALDALDSPPHDPLRLVAWESATLPLTSALLAHAPISAEDEDVPQARGCVVLVGPEGGLSPEEVTLAGGHGFVAVSLGPRILRTETVAPVLLFALSVLRGDLATR